MNAFLLYVIMVSAFLLYSFLVNSFPLNALLLNSFLRYASLQSAFLQNVFVLTAFVLIAFVLINAWWFLFWSTIKQIYFCSCLGLKKSILRKKIGQKRPKLGPSCHLWTKSMSEMESFHLKFLSSFKITILKPFLDPLNLSHFFLK